MSDHNAKGEAYIERKEYVSAADQFLMHGLELTWERDQENAKQAYQMAIACLLVSHRYDEAAAIGRAVRGWSD